MILSIPFHSAILICTVLYLPLPSTIYCDQVGRYCNDINHVSVCCETYVLDGYACTIDFFIVDVTLGSFLDFGIDRYLGSYG